MGTASFEVTNRVTTEVRKPDGLKHDRVYGFSVNFCDRTTWYHDAVEATDNFVATAAQTAFQLSHGTASASGDAANEAIIDLSHGKVGDENDIVPAGGFWRAMGNGRISPSPTDPFGLWGPNPGNLSGYVPIVTVNGTEQTERAYGESTGGDYEINYPAGTVTFFNGLTAGDAVAVTYFWVDSTCEGKLEIIPPAGKNYLIEKVEIQTTADVVIKGDMVSNVYVDSAVFGLTPGTPMQSRRPTILKNFKDVHNWAHLVHPEGNAQAVSDPRGLPSPVRVHEVRYLSEIPLLNSMGAKMHIGITGNIPFDGTWASVVVYGITDDE